MGFMDVFIGLNFDTLRIPIRDISKITTHNTVIGAGSVETKDVPANVVAVGNLCHVLRPISEHDKEYFYRDRKINWGTL